jgi:hypothetical protein
MRFAPLAREHTAEALSTLVEIMRNGRGDAVKLAAAEAILDHLHASRHAMLPRRCRFGAARHLLEQTSFQPSSNAWHLVQHRTPSVPKEHIRLHHDDRRLRRSRRVVTAGGLFDGARCVNNSGEPRV